MSYGEHFHHFHIVLKSTVEDLGEREGMTIWKQCDCGAINKTQKLVSHFDGKEWSKI